MTCTFFISMLLISTGDAFITSSRPVSNQVVLPNSSSVFQRQVTILDHYSSLSPQSTFSRATSATTTSSTGLLLSSKNEDPNDDKEDGKKKTEISQKAVGIWKILVTKLASFFPTLRVAITSFTVGAIFALAVIFVPVYSSVDKMSEPVTLFETILSDLEAGYVDDVDTKKLFETGVSAMLKSLDPYTEFETRQESQDLTESISGKYGGIGLVISGSTAPKSALESGTSITNPTSNEEGGSKILPKDALNDNVRLINGESVPMSVDDDEDLISEDDYERAEMMKDRKEKARAIAKASDRGIRVVTAFEGYAFDYGMRPGDKLVAVDGWRLERDTVVEDVRNRLRGEPGSSVDITFERQGVNGEQTVTLPRRTVQISDVKLATLIGKAEDGVGYIQLSGFTSNAGREVRNAIFSLQQASEQASGGQNSLQSLVLDLRGNPGGLLTSAVDVSSLLVPKGSEIVSARGRGFPGVTYKSRVEPILDPQTKLAVLINGSTASAAEIVSGAVQDLDVGVIVGSGRSFGKGLVQNVEMLPFETALKFTVAKYYTPSGRCIQSTNYKEGSGSDGKYQASKVQEKDKTVFYTTNGREVKDGGGIAADFKANAPKASALEVTLIRSGVVEEFASEWSKTNQFTNGFEVDDNLYRDFQRFVMEKEKSGDLKLDAFYRGPIEDLNKALKLSGYKGSTKELDQLQATIKSDMSKDFVKYKKDIKEDIATGILSRYLPESMLINRSIQNDQQVLAAVKLLSNQNQFDKLLSRTNDQVPSRSMASNAGNTNIEENGAKMNVKF